MILIQATASVKGNEITFRNELHETYTISLADAKKTGLYRLVENPEELPEEELPEEVFPVLPMFSRSPRI